MNNSTVFILTSVFYLIVIFILLYHNRCKLYNKGCDNCKWNILFDAGCPDDSPEPPSTRPIPSPSSPPTSPSSRPPPPPARPPPRPPRSLGAPFRKGSVLSPGSRSPGSP